jgi:hypothetical protein
MPPQPRWLLRVPEIVEELSAIDVPVVDRAMVERVFGLRRRQAINLMRAFGGYQLGKTALVERSAILEKLRLIIGGDRFVFEWRRRERLSEQLEQLRKHRQAASVAIAVEPDPPPDASLPPGVRLEAGRLTIDFASVEDLLSKLYGIAQAAAEDFGRFESAARRRPESPEA